MNNEEEKKSLKDSIRKLKEEYPLMFKILRGTYRVTAKIGMLLTNPSFLFGSQRSGFLEGSILQNPLYVLEESGLELTYTSPGDWIAHNLGSKPSNLNTLEGRLLCFPLEDIIGNDKDTLTPTGHLDLLDCEHFATMERPQIGELERMGLVEETTYEDAFKKMGKYKNYGGYLEAEGANKKKVYQITPKGNGLVFVTKRGGNKRARARESLSETGRDLVPVRIKV